MVKFYEQALPTNKLEKPKKDGLSKKTIDIIRTTQRNNIDLTSLADNKANVMLSLNAIIIAALVPIIMANLGRLEVTFLFIPLAILAITCFVSVYISAQVLKPSDFENIEEREKNNLKPSPFFFGNFYKMEVEEYFVYLKESLSDSELIESHLAQDLFYVGKRLGEKMALVRRAYNIFTIGIFMTLVSTVVVLLIF